MWTSAGTKPANIGTERAASYPEGSANAYPKAKAASKKAPARNPASYPAGSTPPKE
jgi:hypothetical protein